MVFETYKDTRKILGKYCQEEQNREVHGSYGQGDPQCSSQMSPAPHNLSAKSIDNTKTINTNKRYLNLSTSEKVEKTMELTKSKTMLYHPPICTFQFLLQVVSRNPH